MQQRISFFHLRGGIDYKRLSIVHRVMMGMLKLVISRKDPSDLSEDDKGLLATYGKKVDFTDKSTIKPLLSYLER